MENVFLDSINFLVIREGNRMPYLSTSEAENSHRVAAVEYLAQTAETVQKEKKGNIDLSYLLFYALYNIIIIESVHVRSHNFRICGTIIVTSLDLPITR